MAINRRHALAATAATIAAGVLPRSGFGQANTIKIGTIVDTSGPLQPFGVQKLQCLQLAVEEINIAGGLLGRQLDSSPTTASPVTNPMPNSRNKLHCETALRSSMPACKAHHAKLSDRSCGAPILFISTIRLMKGGVCDRNTFCTGTTPGQLLANLLPYMINKFGKRIYVLAAVL